MHALYDVAAVVEHPFYVLRVDGTREMRVAVVFPVPGLRTDALQEESD